MKLLSLLVVNSECRVISCHLGNGCSVTASKGGVSMDTSMGLGPLEGLMMGQRSGDVDPTLLQILNKKLGMSLNEIMDLLNTESGFKGTKEREKRREIFLIE